MPELLALPEPDWIGNITIGSNDFLDYLRVYDTTIFRGSIQFAPILDLEYIEPFLRELHTTEQVGYVFSSEARESINKHDLALIKHPTLREIEKQRREAWRNILDDQKPVERYLSVYYNKEDNKEYVKPLSYGEYGKVAVDTLELIKEGHTPLIEIHSHPDNSLFSAPDYQRMVMMGDRLGTQRIVKGAIVVCPNIQILAVATPETLFVPFEKLDSYTETWGLEQSDHMKRIGEINKQLVEIVNRPFWRRAEAVIQGHKKITEEERRYLKGLYAEDEFKRVIDKITETAKQDLEASYEENPSRKKEEDALVSERNKLVLLYSLELARFVHPKLYFATDFRHFKELTA